MSRTRLSAALRILAVVIIASTLVMLWVNGARDGAGTLYFLWPDIVLCLALLIAAVRGGRDLLLAAYALAGGVFMTATLGGMWTEGLGATPPGAAIGFFACLIAIALLLRRTSSQP
jgi:hypothetical protein